MPHTYSTVPYFINRCQGGQTIQKNRSQMYSVQLPAFIRVFRRIRGILTPPEGAPKKRETPGRILELFSLTK
jgi:hypothetical protein